MMGTEQPLMRHLAALVDFKTGRASLPAPIPWIETGLGGSTPNHRGLRAACWYGDGWAGSKEKLLGFFQEQEDNGIQTIGGSCEVLSATHDQIWIGLVGFTIYEATRRRDAEVIEAATRWFRSYFALCESMQYQRKERRKPWVQILSPGARAFKKDGSVVQALASNGGRDLAFAIVYGHPLPPGNGPKWKGNKYNLGARCLSLLSEDRKLRPVPDEPVPMAYPLWVRRYENGDFIAAFEPQLPPQLKGCDAAGVEGGIPWVEEHLDHDRAERYAGRTPIATIEFPAVK